MTKLLHADLSYQVRGVLFHVFNTLGPLLKEAYYRDAVALGLRKRGIACDVEQGFEVAYKGERVGLYYVDVWIEQGKILLELKVAPTFAPLHKAQAISYLKVTDADLAMLVNYGEKSLKIERLPNFVRQTPPKHFVWRQPPVNPQWLYPELVNSIQHACFRVHFTLGSGFLNQIYRRAVMIEFRRQGLGFDYIKQLPVEYEGQVLGQQDVRLIVVEGKIVVAAFARQHIDDGLREEFKARVRRLQVTFGVLVNFYGTSPSIEMVRMPTAD
jgi:GxxExxY protein